MYRRGQLGLSTGGSGRLGSGQALRLKSPKTPFDAPAYMGSSTGNSVSSPGTLEQLEKGELTHIVPVKMTDHLSVYSIKFLRWIADKFFRERYIHRALMLVAMSGTPNTGIIAGEHFRSQCSNVPPQGLRINASMWECRRMHQTIVTSLVEPTVLDRVGMLIAQIYQFVFFFVLSLCSPRAAYRLSGYLAEEASVVLTHLINDIDMGKVQDLEAPALAVEYWGIQAQPGVGGGVVSVDPFLFVPEVNRMSPMPSMRKSKEGNMTPVPSSTEDDTSETESLASSVQSTAPIGESSSNPSSSHPQPKRVPRLRDVVLLMRADEMAFRDLAHKIADAYEKENRKKEDVY